MPDDKVDSLYTVGINTHICQVGIKILVISRPVYHIVTHWTYVPTRD